MNIDRYGLFCKPFATNRQFVVTRGQPSKNHAAFFISLKGPIDSCRRANDRAGCPQCSSCCVRDVEAQFAANPLRKNA
jgi:hypothetical protein